MKYISRLTALLLALVMLGGSAGALTLDTLTEDELAGLYHAAAASAEVTTETGVLGMPIELSVKKGEDLTGFTFQWHEVIDGNLMEIEGATANVFEAVFELEEKQFQCLYTDAQNNAYQSKVFSLAAKTSDDEMEDYLDVLYGSYNDLYYVPAAPLDDYMEAAYTWMQTWNVTLADGANLAEKVHACWMNDPFPEELLCSCAGEDAAFCINSPEAEHDELCGWNPNVKMTDGNASKLVIHVPENAFSSEYRINAGLVEELQTLSTVEDALRTVFSDAILIDAYDINFTSASGEKVQPAEDAPIKLTFAIPTEMLAVAQSDGTVIYPEDLVVLHMTEGETGYIAERVGYSLTVKPDREYQYLSVNASAFSIYVVAGVGSTTGEPAGSTLTMKVGETIVLYSDYKSPSYESYLWEASSVNNNFEIKGNDIDSRYVTITARNEGTIVMDFKYWGILNGDWDYCVGESVEIIAVPPVAATFVANGGTGGPYELDVINGTFVFPKLEDTGITPPEGAAFAGWGTQSGSGGDTYAADIEGTTESDVTYYALWYYPGTEQGGWTYAKFFFRLDGEIKPEPNHGYGAEQYVSAGIGHIFTAVEITNNLAAIKANIAQEPSNMQGFDPETQEIVWYVIKYEPTDGWHVDGVIRDKAKFEVEYHPNGGDTNYPGSNQHTVGSTVSVNYDTIPNHAGYIFRGWDENPNAGSPTYVYDTRDPASFVMPPNNVVLYAVWRPSDATKYTVEHYLCDTNGKNPQLASEATQIMYGTTGQTVTAGYLTTFAGYEIYPAHSSTIRTGTIAGDGSLVLKLYYRLVCSTLTIKKNGMSTEDGESAIFEVKAYTKAKGAAEQETFVVTVSNGESVVIGDLLIDKEYTVTEITDWTWRYTSTASASGTIVATGSIVTFANSKQNDKWLGDESSVTNNMSSGYVYGYNNE